jgi:hypothetical protein
MGFLMAVEVLVLVLVPVRQVKQVVMVLEVLSLLRSFYTNDQTIS